MIYKLMHKNIPVAALHFSESGTLLKIVSVYEDILLPYPARKDIASLKEWIADRAVPVTRHGVDFLLKSQKVSNTGLYMLDNLGLSLTDCYWLCPVNVDYTWEEVNLFSNDFAPALLETQDKTIAQVPRQTRFSKYSPDATLKGDLKKKWLIREDGTRILVKGNFGIGCQQSLNEKFVTLINKRQNKVPFVSYDITTFSFDGADATCCVSENFIPDDTVEFISAYDILQSEKSRASLSLYVQFLNGCKKIGLDADYVKDFLSYQIMLDYLVTNTDRHFNNFGIIRDASSLRPLSMAPIYDSGSCLFWNRENPVFFAGMMYKVKTHSFLKYEDRMLRYVKDPFCLDLGVLPTAEELWQIYSEGNVLSQRRIDFITRCYQAKIESIDRLQTKAKFQNKDDDFERE